MGRDRACGHCPELTGAPPPYFLSGFSMICWQHCIVYIPPSHVPACLSRLALCDLPINCFMRTSGAVSRPGSAAKIYYIDTLVLNGIDLKLSLLTSKLLSEDLLAVRRQLPVSLVKFENANIILGEFVIEVITWIVAYCCCSFRHLQQTPFV